MVTPLTQLETKLHWLVAVSGDYHFHYGRWSTLSEEYSTFESFSSDAGCWFLSSASTREDSSLRNSDLGIISVGPPLSGDWFHVPRSFRVEPGEMVVVRKDELSYFAYVHDVTKLDGSLVSRDEGRSPICFLHSKSARAGQVLRKTRPVFSLQIFCNGHRLDLLYGIQKIKLIDRSFSAFQTEIWRWHLERLFHYLVQLIIVEHIADQYRMFLRRLERDTDYQKVV